MYTLAVWIFFLNHGLLVCAVVSKINYNFDYKKCVDKKCIIILYNKPISVNFTRDSLKSKRESSYTFFTFLIKNIYLR